MDSFSIIYKTKEDAINHGLYRLKLDFIKDSLGYLPPEEFGFSEAEIINQFSLLYNFRRKLIEYEIVNERTKKKWAIAICSLEFWIFILFFLPDLGWSLQFDFEHIYDFIGLVICLNFVLVILALIPIYIALLPGYFLSRLLMIVFNKQKEPEFQGNPEIGYYFTKCHFARQDDLRDNKVKNNLSYKEVKFHYAKEVRIESQLESDARANVEENINDNVKKYFSITCLISSLLIPFLCIIMGEVPNELITLVRSCVVAIFIIFTLLFILGKQTHCFITLGIVCLYQQQWPVHFDKSIWIIFDIAVSLFLIYLTYNELCNFKFGIIDKKTNEEYEF